MRSVTIAISIGLILSGCWSEQDVKEPANKCATDTYPSYSAKNLKQCEGRALGGLPVNAATLSVTLPLEL